MKGQKGRILEALRRCPQSNYLLSLMSLKYTSRISELRQMGYKIKCDDNYGKGTRIYTLHEARTRLAEMEAERDE